MKEYLTKIFAKREWYFYVKAIVSALTIILSIIFIILERSLVSKITIQFTDTSVLAFVFLLVGGLLGIVFTFLDMPSNKILSIVNSFDFIPSIFYALGVGFIIYALCFPLADLANSNGVCFFTQNSDNAHKFANLYIVFLVFFVIVLLISIVLAYFSPKEKDKVEVKN